MTATDARTALSYASCLAIAMAVIPQCSLNKSSSPESRNCPLPYFNALQPIFALSPPTHSNLNTHTSLCVFTPCEIFSFLFFSHSLTSHHKHLTGEPGAGLAHPVAVPPTAQHAPFSSATAVAPYMTQQPSVLSSLDAFGDVASPASSVTGSTSASNTPLPPSPLGLHHIHRQQAHGLLGQQQQARLSPADLAKLSSLPIRFRALPHDVSLRVLQLCSANPVVTVCSASC